MTARRRRSQDEINLMLHGSTRRRMYEVNFLVNDQQRQDDDLANWKNTAVNAFGYAAYGGIRNSTPASGSTIGGAWQTLNLFDTEIITVPRGITQDLANNGLIFEQKGVYVLSVALDFEHNSSNQGRTTHIRIWNATDGVAASGEYVLGVGRNAEASGVSLPILVEVDATGVNDLYQVQIGNGDTISSVVWVVQNMSAWSVGEYRGILPG